MKFPEVLVCVGLALLVTIEAGVVPPKAGLSLKDKLALDIPLKQHVTNKTTGKNDAVKVAFSTTTTTSSTSTTTTSTSTSTTTTESPKQSQRPKYVDAAVFRHQFTTPSPSEVSEGEDIVVDTLTRFRGREPQQEAESGVSPYSRITKIPIIPLEETEILFEDAGDHDYEAHLGFWEDGSSLGGEIGFLGEDRRSSSYIESFRPLGF